MTLAHLRASLQDVPGLWQATSEQWYIMCNSSSTVVADLACGRKLTGVLCDCACVWAQVRGMEDVSFCSIIGIAGIVLALVIAAAKLCVLRMDDYAPTRWLRKCADSGFRGCPGRACALTGTCSMQLATLLHC